MVLFLIIVNSFQLLIVHKEVHLWCCSGVRLVSALVLFHYKNKLSCRKLKYPKTFGQVAFFCNIVKGVIDFFRLLPQICKKAITAPHPVLWYPNGYNLSLSQTFGYLLCTRSPNFWIFTSL